jgi:hypothetical protein
MRFLDLSSIRVGVTGRVDLARGILAELTTAAQQGHVESFDFALVNVGLGDREEAISWNVRARSAIRICRSSQLIRVWQASLWFSCTSDVRKGARRLRRAFSR